MKTNTNTKTKTKAPARARLRRPGRDLAEAIRQFLTPWGWRQGHCRTQPLRPQARWTLQPLVLTVLALTWCGGDSLGERFETAKAFCAVTLPKRRRPGRSRVGFAKALAKLPSAALQALAGGVRRQMQRVFGASLLVQGFLPFGVDGSRLECPRAAELERRLPSGARSGAAPALWVTALVHLGLGLLWTWQLGLATACERSHLMRMLPTLPAGALVVADAGFNGFFQAQQVMRAGGSFLIRMSSKVRLRTDRPVDSANWCDGQVYYWSQEADQAGQLPLRVRLIRIRARRSKHDVWLLTDVLDKKRLPKQLAAQFYRWRWENEGLFRTYKRTLKQVKLSSRTVRLVHREAAGALLAMQVLLALGGQAVRPRVRSARQEKPGGCSARQVLLAIREELMECQASRRRPRLGQRLQAAQRERRPGRRSSKSSREWLRRVPHKPPKPPILLTFTEKQKARILRLKRAKK
jgi:Transposase DDE domain